VDVDGDDGGLERDREEHGFFPVGRLSKDLEVFVRLDQLAQELSDLGMVIDEKTRCPRSAWALVNACSTLWRAADPRAGVSTRDMAMWRGCKCLACGERVDQQILFHRSLPTPPQPRPGHVLPVFRGRIDE
jgi:hypothetical protein